jgi:hypothetical protein
LFLKILLGGASLTLQGSAGQWPKHRKACFSFKRNNICIETPDVVTKGSIDRCSSFAKMPSIAGITGEKRIALGFAGKLEMTAHVAGEQFRKALLSSALHALCGCQL